MIVQTIGEPHLGSDQNDLAIVEDNTRQGTCQQAGEKCLEFDLPAIIAHIAVTNWHTNINHNILAIRMVYNASKHLPRVQKGIAFKESVKNAIAYGRKSICAQIPTCLSH